MIAKAAARTRLTLLAPLLIPIGLILFSSFALAQATAAPMSNDDVVKLAKAGFGAELIEAKIKQAGAVDFKLEIDDLTKLKAAGVPQPVIAAMLQRSTAGSSGENPGTAPAPSGPRQVGVGPNGMPVYSDIGRVKLVSAGHADLDLRSIGGSMSTTFAYVTTLVHANFPGLKADQRTQDHRPTIVVKSPQSPKGRYYIVSADVDEKNNVRSVKMGNMRLFGAKNLGAPDSDNQMEYDAVAEGPDTWKLTPKKDLKPGEYGLWGSMAELYDFGVDP